MSGRIASETVSLEEKTLLLRVCPRVSFRSSEYDFRQLPRSTAASEQLDIDSLVPVLHQFSVHSPIHECVSY